MKVIEPSVEIIDMKDGQEILNKIEKIGRVCYKSENRITNNSAEKFCKRFIEMGHESVIEHESITLKVICDRGVSHEIVRHRIAEYSQESTRYATTVKISSETRSQSFGHAFLKKVQKATSHGMKAVNRRRPHILIF